VFSVLQLNQALVLANCAVVLVAVDAAGFLILLLVQSLAVGLGEMAVIPGAHAALFPVDTGFLMLKARGFASGGWELSGRRSRLGPE
jgi:hypothetical protein